MLMFPYIANLLAAMLLGALIGAERQWRQRMAGLRTNALVATGAAVFILSSIPHRRIVRDVLPRRWFPELVFSAPGSSCGKA